MSSSGEAAITVPHGGMSSFTFSAAAPASKATKVEFVVLSDKNMFGIKHGYNARLMDLYKDIPKEDKSFDQASKMWQFSWSRYTELHAKFSKAPGVDLHTLPASLVEQFCSGAIVSPAASAGGKFSPAAIIPPSLWAALMAFQKTGVEYAVSHNGRVLFGDEMGLGKSIQALATAVYYRTEWPLLIICPKAVLSSWRNELLRWVPDLEEGDICVLKRGGDALFGTVRVVTYDMAASMVAKSIIAPGEHKVVIADESHLLKSHEAKRTKCIVPLLRSAKRAMCLSGTPALSRPAELYTQISALAPNAFGTFKKFSARYCEGFQNKFGGWQARGSSHAEELKALLEKTVMIRRFKKDVLSSLPPKKRFVVKVPIEPPSVARKLSDGIAALRKLDAKLRAALTLDQKSEVELQRRALMAQLYRESGVAKVAAVGKFLDKFMLPPLAADSSAGIAFVDYGDADKLSAPSASTSAAFLAIRAPASDAGPPLSSVTSGKSVAASKRRAFVVEDSEEELLEEEKRVAAAPPKRPLAAVVVDDSEGEVDEDEEDDEEEPAKGGKKKRGKTATDAAAPSGPPVCPACGSTLAFLGGACAPCDAAAFVAAYEPVPSSGEPPSLTSAVVDVEDAPEPVEAASTAAVPVDSTGLPVGAERTGKIVIFGHHRDVLDGIEECIRSRGYQSIRIDGGTSAKQQQAYVRRFQADPECQVALVGITAAGSGITLTSATACVFAELYWNPGTLNQAEDRIHRIGQTAASVQMIYLVGTDGIDEDIWAIVGRKIDVLSGSLQAKKSGFTTAVTATGGVPGANARGTVLQQLQLQASARGGPAAAPAKPQLQLQPATVSAAHKPSEVVVVDEDEDFDLLCVLAADAVAASHKSSQ